MATTSTEKIDWVELNKLIAEKIDIVFNYFNIEYSNYQNRVAFACPVHESTNKESANIFISGDEKYGNFVCWSNHCEETCGKGAINLVCHLLSRKEKTSVGLMEASKLLKSILNITDFKTVLDNSTSKFSNFVLKDKHYDKKAICSKKYLVDTLEMPSKYFLSRGFSGEILEKYSIGYCRTFGKKMYMRSVAPVFNEDDPNSIIGCVGRTHYDKCVICEKYHSPNKMCPSNRLEELWASKWINSDNFHSGKNLYGLWFAKNSITSTGKIVLVEGQGDVWRVNEGGIENVVGMFGSNFTDYHRAILDSLGVMDVYVASDNDEAGIKCYESILDRYKNLYNIHRVSFSQKDVGDIPKEDIRKIFKGVD